MFSESKWNITFGSNEEKKQKVGTNSCMFNVVHANKNSAILSGSSITLRYNVASF
jgi:hypothetical protein